MSDPARPDPSRPGPAHKPASVTLRAGAGDEGAMDPANQSLAEALNLTFRILQFGMAVLFVVFALSGFQTIKESESGIRLLFGRVADDNLPSGFRFSYPYPLGELIKVPTGTTTLDLDLAFWPALTADQRNMTIQQLATIGKTSLKPGVDGSLITGDQNIAHTKWRIVYRRADPRLYANNVYTEDEDLIVMAAAMRGVVQAVAQVRIDDLLKQSSGDEGSVAARARAIAQGALDRSKTGIEISQLTLETNAAPLNLYSDFSGVQTAVQKSGEKLSKAQTEAGNTLNAVAGPAHPYLIDQIGRFERASALNDKAARDAALAAIDALLDGREVQIDGRAVGPIVSGNVTSIINDARQYKTSVVSRARAQLAIFNAKLEQFRSNPRVMVQRDWADALTAFLSRENVEVFVNPPLVRTMELVLSRDPDIIKEFERVRKEAANLLAAQRRDELNRKEQFKTDTEATRARE